MAKLSSTHIYGDLYVDGAINGNASTATILKTTRKINGTDFNGSANITTANWGTARTLTIGNKGQSVNGSANVTWSLADIGAAASNHGHDYYVQGSSASRTTDQNGNANDITKSGFYRVSSSSATANPFPDNNHSHILHGQHPSTAGYQYQIAVPYSVTNKIYFRNNPNSSWGSWNRIYHTGDKPTASDIGAAPTSHASTGTSYGVSSASNYGHAMASGTTPKANGTAAVGSETAKFARGDHVHPLQTSVSGSSGSCTGNAATATKLATARSIALSGHVTGSANFDGSGNITIATTVNDITTITKSLKVTAAWMDTGIVGANLTTGTYAVQVYGNFAGQGSLWEEYFSGIMSWFVGGCNSSDSNEIYLHAAGHATNGCALYLRTIRQSSGSALKLQIATDKDFTSEVSISFKFKKLI